MSSHVTGSRRRGRGRWIACLAAIAAAALVAGCSSSGSGSNTAASSGSAADASSGPGVAQARSVVDQFSQRPTKIQVTEKISKPIPKGKTVYFVSCGTPNCAEETDIIREATDALGWTLKTINTDGTPESQKNAFDQVARAKADAVLYSAVDRSTFASDIPTLKQNGTFVAGCCITDPIGNGIDFANETPDQTGAVGNLLAAWVAAESGGTAHAVYVNLPAIPILTDALNTYKAKLDTYCDSKCKTDTLDIPITALGKDVPTRVVAYLRAHPDVKYVAICTDALTIGLPAALKAAGLSDVKIIGQGADPTNLQYIHSGQENASVAFPYYESLWALVDAVARHEAGVPVPASTAPPQWLLTKDNAPDATKIFPVVPDVEAQFKALWGVS